MAPSHSALRGNKKPSWEVAQYYRCLRDQPAILVDAPKKKPKDTPVPGAGADPNYVSHDIYYERGPLKNTPRSSTNSNHTAVLRTTAVGDVKSVTC